MRYTKHTGAQQNESPYDSLQPHSPVFDNMLTMHRACAVNTQSTVHRCLKARSSKAPELPICAADCLAASSQLAFCALYLDLLSILFKWCTGCSICLQTALKSAAKHNKHSYSMHCTHIPSAAERLHTCPLLRRCCCWLDCG